MVQCHNYGPLFLVEAVMSCEAPRLVYTASNFEGAVEEVERYRSTDAAEYDDCIKVTVVQPGPGQGITVARWYPQRPSFEDVVRAHPCDGEGPPMYLPETRWERAL